MDDNLGQNPVHLRPFSAIFGHFPVQQSQAELCKDSQSLTEVYGSCEVMLNDASCNEVIQSKEVTSLGLEPRTYGLKVCCSTN